MSKSSEVLAFEASAVKSGYSTSEEALVATSFKIELPSFFGNDPEATLASADTRVLPAIKTYAAWDSQDGYTGARHRYNKMIEDTKKD